MAADTSSPPHKSSLEPANEKDPRDKARKERSSKDDDSERKERKSKDRDGKGKSIYAQNILVPHDFIGLLGGAVLFGDFICILRDLLTSCV